MDPHGPYETPKQVPELPDLHAFSHFHSLAVEWVLDDEVDIPHLLRGLRCVQVQLAGHHLPALCVTKMDSTVSSDASIYSVRP